MKKSTLLACFAVLAATLICSSAALAQQQSGIVKAFERLNTGFATIPNVIAIVAQLVGFVMVFKSTFALRAIGDRDDGSKHDANRALFLFLAGMLAVGLPAVIGLGATTFFGSTSAVMTEGQAIKYRN